MDKFRRMAKVPSQNFNTKKATSTTPKKQITMTTDITPPTLDPLIIPGQSSLGQYGLRGVQILASSDPSSQSCLFHEWSPWPQEKKVLAITDAQLVATFEEKMHPFIISALLSRLEGSTWVLNLLKFGFADLPTQDVIHLVVEQGAIDTETASAIVRQIMEIVQAAQWTGEPIRVDVCQDCHWKADIRATDDMEIPDSRNPRKYYETQYQFGHPLAGSSIGPAALPNWAGTLTGYVQHVTDDETKVYALTCEHVVNSKDKSLLGCEPYKYKDGQMKHLVLSPARTDHDDAQWSISNEIADLYRSEQHIALAEVNAAKEHASRVHSQESTEDDADHADHLNKLANEKADALKSAKKWEAMRKATENYETNLGYVYATSGDATTPETKEGLGSRFDWALVDCAADPKTTNKHTRMDSDNFPSPLRRSVLEALGNDCFDAMAAFFRPGRAFNPVRKTPPVVNEVFFKLPSRTMPCTGGQYNGVHATIRERRKMTREWCFVAWGKRRVMSKGGDSGAVIVDRFFNPIAIVWGGDLHQNPRGFGVEDLTYGTSIASIMTHIESVMGWEKGSVSFC